MQQQREAHWKAQNSMDDLMEHDTRKGEQQDDQGRAAQAAFNAK